MGSFVLYVSSISSINQLQNVIYSKITELIELEPYASQLAFLRSLQFENINLKFQVSDC
jgi:hypothetical protein